MKASLFSFFGTFEELREDQIARNFETNFFGAMSVIRTALPILREDRRSVSCSEKTRRKFPGKSTSYRQG